MSLGYSTASSTASQGQPIDAVMIDLDGTLIDTLDDFLVVLNATLADLKFGPIERHFVECTVGQGSQHLIASTLAYVGAPPSLFELAWARYVHHYTRLNGQQAALYPGVMQGLQRIQAQGLPMACLTNKPLAFATALLEKKTLTPFFKVIFGGDSFEHKKPHPQPLLEACRVLGSVPERTLMLGDSSNDAQAARAAGCPVLLVRYGYNHGQSVEAVDADGWLDRLDAIDWGGVWLASGAQTVAHRVAKSL
jgi:phosphoglycolate phosphatase